MLILLVLFRRFYLTQYTVSVILVIRWWETLKYITVNTNV